MHLYEEEEGNGSATERMGVGGACPHYELRHYIYGLYMERIGFTASHPTHVVEPLEENIATEVLLVFI